MKTQCTLCPHLCLLEEDQVGLCRARTSKSGRIISQSYGLLTAIHLDPIEKKPLAQYHPGSMILSVGTFGCNLRCPFCQNASISQVSSSEIETVRCLPEDLIRNATALIPKGNIGVAFTYNEPLVGYEYVLDSSRLLHEAGLKSVIVTNGMINQAPMQTLLPYVDAMNIDLKGFTQDFYTKCKGSLQAVKDTISLCADSCHVEVTTLIVPGMNDNLDEIDRLSSFLKSINPEIVLHLTRFFPRFRMTDTNPTDINLLKKMKAVARSHLANVFLGNI